MKKTAAIKKPKVPAIGDYTDLIGGIGSLLEVARRTSARAVNALMTATYWEIGRRIVEFEQGGEKRAEYGESLLARLSLDLGQLHGRGFSQDNLESMRQFYQAFSPKIISETVSRKLEVPQSASVKSNQSLPSPNQLPLDNLQLAFPLPWSHYVLLARRSRSPEALDFYQTEALRGGWSVRQLRAS
jgi:hypothetical protein